MIKIHVISGFLGAGKTTLIMKIAQALRMRGEKIVIIENEFGEVGIDNILLAGEGFKVFDISNGCICCTMKYDFIAAFMEIKEKLRPDRILIEPSGIFVLDSLFDILQNTEIMGAYALDSILTVIDARHYMRHEEVYAEFMKSQVENASKLILSKTEKIQDATKSYILQSLKKLNPSAKVVCDYMQMDSGELLSLLDESRTCCTCGHDHHAHQHCEYIDHSNDYEKQSHTQERVDGHKHPHEDQAVHTVFDTLLLKPDMIYSKEYLQNKLDLLPSGEFGNIIRAKGFLKSEKGFHAVNYVDGETVITYRLREVPVGLEVIGMHLDKDKLTRLF